MNTNSAETYIIDVGHANSKSMQLINSSLTEEQKEKLLHSDLLFINPLTADQAND